MDLAESGINRNTFIKMRGAKISGKVRPSLILIRAFFLQILCNLVQSPYSANYKRPENSEKVFSAHLPSALIIHCAFFFRNKYIFTF
jgi:hypothetical protein